MWTQGNTSYAFVKLTFPDDGYRVADWGQVFSGFGANALIERNAATVSVPITTAHIYNLGTLANGNYSFTFTSNRSAPQTAQLTVAGQSVANPIDDARTFARQHYEDFLSRTPDEPGLNFWTNEITVCGSDAACVDRKRVSVSGSFFLSSEFQSTGYYVYRLYKGGLNRQPRFVEFLPEVRSVASGIVVGNSLSPTVIDNNKRAFALSFVQRSDFRQKFPEDDRVSSANFVDQLFAATGSTPSTTERNALIAELDASTGTLAERRASVLYKIVDGTSSEQEGVGVRPIFNTRYGREFYDREYNRAFVLMQYFGYLRRDPDAEGYNFWLTKLNTFGNFIDAEMVRSFILAAEYRARFGQP
jgi:hypothetical protein